MGLFRPYEQGTSKKTGPTEETVEAGPGSSTESSSSSATTAPRRAPKTSSTGRKQRASKGDHATKKPQTADHKAPVAQPKTVSRHTAKKGPTPTRAEAEAARRHRLNPTLSKKEARKRERLAKRERQAAAMEVMVIWLAMLFIAPTAVGAINAMSLGMLIVMILWLIDSWRLWHGAKKGIRARYPSAPLRGLWSYLNNRAMTVRRWRNPAPRVERGERIDS